MRSGFLQLFFGAFFLIQAHAQTEEDAIKSSLVPERQKKVMETLPGPWGHLEYYQVPLRCPDKMLSLIPVPSQKTEWILPASPGDDITQFFLRAGLTPDEIAPVLFSSKVMQDEEIFRVFPTDETVLNMTPEMRIKIYGILAHYEENRFYRHPIYINSSNLSEWFQGANLPRSVIQDIASLAYPTRNGRGFYLSDVAFTLRRAENATDERSLLQGLFRRQGLIVRLRLSRETLSQGIADYWRIGYKRKAVMPLLESLIAEKGEGVIDVAHLLPPTPRQFLNRFPDISNGISGRFPDWFWTCYNFFRFVPRNVYADSDNRDQLIQEEFEEAILPNQFGDMLLLNSGGKVLHGCIYIADDIVYTKNGADMFSPWIMMKIQDVVAYHDIHGDVSIQTFRKRPAVAEISQ